MATPPTLLLYPSVYHLFVYMSLSSSNGVTTSASTSHSRPPPTRPPRKRKHSSNSNSHSSKQQKFTYNSEKQSGIKDHLTVIDTDMAQQPPSRSFSAPTGTNNHKISLSNHAKGGGNNHTKKQGQGKKLVIKNLKVRKNLPENYGEEAWLKLQEAIQAVHSRRAISYSLEELYKAVENSCSHGMSAMLYNKLKTECELYMACQLPEFNQDMLNDQSYLLVVDKQWRAFCHQMIMIRSIFLYLDRTYAVPHQSLPALWDLGLELFGSLIITKPRIQERVLKGVLAAIQRERCGESVDRTLLSSLLRMFVDLQIYQEVFELEFLKETETVYRSESLRMMRDMQFTLPEYITHVDRRLSQEHDRLLQYLHKTTKKPLIMCVEKQLIGEHLHEVLDKGFESLLEASRYSDLSLLYQLFSRFKDGVPLIRKGFGEYIKKSGMAIVNDTERDKTMVQELLEFKEKVDQIISHSFQNQEKFYDVVRDSFETVINQRKNKPAELVAKYVDTQLRSGNKEWTDEELDRLLDRVMVLFRYIHGKDVFEAFYKKDLAKRLLLGKSASFDAEKSMLLKLKQECGPNFTSKLEGMFKDIELSKEMMITFKQHLQSCSRISGNVELSVNVLTMGYWPYYTPMEILLPQELASYLDVFKDFYLKKHSGRKLQYQPSLGHCVLRASFNHSEKELQVSLFQSLVLMLFNTDDKMTFIYIKQATGIEEGELKRTLQSLALNKLSRVLIKQPKGIEVKPDDEFSINKDFKHKLFRIKINQVQLKETKEENIATNERVFQDRQYQVDAAIVRIMKMRRTLPHNLLVSECLGQLRFDIRPSELKKRIESLIERDYLRRSEENTSIYEYIA